jgi:hypothetical protein
MYLKMPVLSMTVLLILNSLILNSCSSSKQSKPRQSPQEVTDTAVKRLPQSREATEIAKTMDDLAKELAGLLANPGIRNHLRSEINKSSKRENIIFLDEFLTSVVKVSGLPDQTLDKVRIALNNAKGAKRRFKRTNINQMLISSEIDVSFPVRNHRDKWTGSDDLLIASENLDENVQQITAYSVKTQTPMKISTASPPDIPILMVSPCEHHSHTPEILQISDIPPLESAPQKSPSSYIAVNYLKILNDYEPWHKGDPEIYVHFFQTDLKGNISYNRRFFFPGINREDVWYLIPNSFGWNLCIQYLEEKNGPITYFLVYEEDANWSITIDVSIGLITFPITIHEGDDLIDRFEINRNFVGFCPSSSTTYNCFRSWTRTEYGKKSADYEAIMRVIRLH